MKKLILMALFALPCISANAVRFQTTCGYEGTTVDPNFFTTQEEFLEYMTELNDIFCHEEGSAIWW